MRHWALELDLWGAGQEGEGWGGASCPGQEGGAPHSGSPPPVSPGDLQVQAGSTGAGVNRVFLSPVPTGVVPAPQVTSSWLPGSCPPP